MYVSTSFSGSLNSQVARIHSDHNINPNIVNDFYIGNKHFFILLLEQLTDIEQEDFYSTFSVAGQFSSEGRHYAILEQAEERREPEIQQEAEEQQELEKTRYKLATLLTDRELQIVTLVALGWSNKQIASHLEISQWTVSAHLRRIFIKLDVNSRAAMSYQCSALINHLQDSRQINKSKLDFIQFGEGER
ncbi:response regulator transcription factor [Leptolyngbya ohadii]|uniref:response regulator transcription factor n=1 Tax=Leptolyngbya ohadii TaxID=1962290 RepID=UPI000B59BCC0|nr:LuxR C-terminal-related transcriptional regulator [Leptolyngbya ohadii]